MDFRKIIGFGKGSFVVSIPKQWINRHKLKKGDTLYVDDRGMELAISPREEKGEREPAHIVINADNRKEGRIEAEIVSAYLNSYSQIELRGNSLRKNGPEIKRMLHNLSGLELIEQTGSRIVVKDLLDARELSVESLIRRIDLIIRSMLQDSAAALHEDYCESICHRDADVNRLALLARRVINSALANPASQTGKSPLQLLKEWQMVWRLEEAGDYIKRISRMLRRLAARGKPKELKQFEAVTKEMERVYLDVIRAYHTADSELAYKVEGETQSRMDSCDSCITKKSAPAAVMLACHLKGLNALMREMARIAVS